MIMVLASASSVLACEPAVKVTVGVLSSSVMVAVWVVLPPWVAFVGLPMSTITQLRKPWGKAQVLGLADLEPHVVTQRLKATVPRDYRLHHDELRYVKGVINPAVLIQPHAKRPAIVLDDRQEEIVVEEPRTVPDRQDVEEPTQEKQETLFPPPSASETPAVSVGPSALEEPTEPGPPIVDAVNRPTRVSCQAARSPCTGADVISVLMRRRVWGRS